MKIKLFIIYFNISFFFFRIYAYLYAFFSPKIYSL